MLIKEFGHQRQISLCYIRPLSFVQDVFASKYLLEAKNCIDKNVRIHLDIGMQIYQISDMFHVVITHSYE